MTRLLLADVTPLEEPEVYARAYAGCSAERRSAADIFRFGKDRCLSIGAALLLDRGLAAYGLRERDMVYGYGAYEKPFFINAQDIHFSISHSGNKVAVAFSDSEVGCDIEMIGDADLTLAQMFFSRSEYESLLSIGEEHERRRAFFRCWTLKESYMKAVGKGMNMAPESFTVFPGSTVSGGMPEDTGFAFLTPVSFPGYECSLCFKPGNTEPEVLHCKLF